MQENKQEKSLIKQNISLYLAKKGVTHYEFYKISGVTRGVLAQNNGISEDNLTRFLAYASDVNPSWLITGRGDMLLDKQDFSIEQEIPEKKEENLPVAQQTYKTGTGIPLIPIEAMAGALTCEQTVLEYECERYVVPVFKGADFLIPVKGSSMYPKYSSGDIVACQRVPMSDLFFQWNKVYVIDTNQGALIKRIKPGSDKDHVLLVSDNEKYDPFELPYSAIHAVALVLGVIRLE